MLAGSGTCWQRSVHLRAPPPIGQVPLSLAITLSVRTWECTGVVSWPLNMGAAILQVLWTPDGDTCAYSWKDLAADYPQMAHF